MKNGRKISFENFSILQFIMSMVFGVLVCGLLGGYIALLAAVLAGPVPVSMLPMAIGIGGFIGGIIFSAIDISIQGKWIEDESPGSRGSRRVEQSGSTGKSAAEIGKANDNTVGGGHGRDGSQLEVDQREVSGKSADETPRAGNGSRASIVQGRGNPGGKNKV